MKQALLFLCGVVLLLSGCVEVSSSVTTLPVDFDNITEIEIYRNVTEEELIYKIDDEESISAVCEIIKTVEHTGLLGDPSCPYGLKLVICTDTNNYTLSLSTDGCGVIMYNDEFYGSFSERKIRDVIESITGESFDIFLG